jgi:ubiquinone/menaquinone biosynthesis C-methylase UbiE
MDKNYAEYLLVKTRSDYNQIANAFSDSRAFMWEELIPLAKYVQAGEKVLDLGCGNGRLFSMLKEKKVDYLGVDSSDKILEIAKEKHGQEGAKFLVVEALELPFPESYFSKIFSIAVLHHIPSEEFRLKFLSEIKRVLKPNGLLILTVWNLRKNYLLLLKYTILKIIGKSELDSGDVLYSWRDSEGKTVVQRYIHCFKKRELEKLIEKSGFRIKEISFLNRCKSKKANIYLIAEK